MTGIIPIIIGLSGSSARPITEMPQVFISWDERRQTSNIRAGSIIVKELTILAGELAVFFAITSGIKQWVFAFCCRCKAGTIIIKDFATDTRIITEISAVFISIKMGQIARVFT